MANLNGFNANNVEPAADFEPIPAGTYNAVIIKSEMKPTKDGNGSFLELEFQVLDGEYKGRLVWSRLVLENKNELTVKIAKSQLADICKSVGILTPRDSCELHNMPLAIKVALKKRSDNGEATNEIKAYRKRETSAQNSAPAAKGVAPWKR